LLGIRAYNDLVLFALFRPPIGWADIVKRTVHEIQEDNCLGLAAQLAFYFLLAVFPAVLFLVALTGYLPVDQAFAQLLTALGAVAPEEFLALVRQQLEQLSEGRHASLLTLGIAGALWSSSVAMVAIIDSLNHAYDVSEWRPWWKRRLLGLVLTLSLALFTLVALVFVLVGPTLAFQAAAWFRVEPAVVYVWQLIRWPVIVFCVVLGLDLVYHFAPNRLSRWAWITPGSLLATVLWIASSFGFKFYVTNFGDYTATYGAIGGAIVAMLWFYVSGLAILVGAELNGVIEQAARAEARPAEARP
jgi:membrane protein